MLLFNAYSPVGHAIHVCSMTTFVIGDEDVVLPNFEPVNILVNQPPLVAKVLTQLYYLFI